MAVEQTRSGALVVTGDHVQLYRLLAMKSAIKLEMAGLKHSRGSITAQVKREFGFRGNREKVLAQLEALIAERFPKPEDPE